MSVKHRNFYTRKIMKNKLPYQFLIIPDVVYNDKRLSPAAKMAFMYLVRREQYYTSKHIIQEGGWVKTEYATIAEKLGKSREIVRKLYIPELLTAGFIQKKYGAKGYKSECLYRIIWDRIIALDKNDGIMPQEDVDFYFEDNDKPF